MEQRERRARAPRDGVASGHSHTLEASEEYAICSGCCAGSVGGLVRGYKAARLTRTA